ncbi:peptidylprolyl isomerase [Ruminiclostridium papyrosolvens]|uniref:Peptidyl-prolyl cis-trans isomerase n=1 Tax=Ruminiclostridium papyrosolvens C7 TaxID=1330534 RepID=U4R3Q7_9FIRM|nr:peptidylprolyl isomerase [Ruminiclostridium papyrosolvens]EPR12303.1 peptidylprolyl isomerase [Ruminiclostridium papyrosolvens C7]
MIKNLIKKTAFFIITGLIFTVLLSGCGKPGSQGSSNQPSGHPKIQFEMENGDKMTFELYPEYAPETVKNFVSLAESGFYNGLTFHRIIKGFMVQGGDPDGNGSGGSDKNIKGEFSSNGFTQNTLKHTKGIISMARSGDPDSASSQFFIMDETSATLDGEYAAFGKLTSGEETLDKITNTPVELDSNSGEVSLPAEKVIIKAVTVLEK